MRPRQKLSNPRRKVCGTTNKTKYPTLRDAEKGLTFIWGSDPTADLKDLHAYHCNYCGGFHVGHLSAYQKHLARIEKNASIVAAQ